MPVRAKGGRLKKDTSEVVDLVKSVRKHKKFKQLASYSVQCLQKVRHHCGGALACLPGLAHTTRLPLPTTGVDTAQRGLGGELGSSL